MPGQPPTCAGCPLYGVGAGFVLGSGNPKTAKVGLLLEAPGREELLWRVDEEELSLRVRAYSHLFCSSCGSTMKWDEHLQKLRGGLGESPSLRQTGRSGILTKQPQQILRVEVSNSLPNSEKNCPTPENPPSLSELPEDFSPETENKKIRKVLHTGAFQRKNLQSEVSICPPMAQRGTLPRQEFRVHSLVRRSPRETQESQRTSLENGTAPREETKTQGTCSSQERNSLRQSSEKFGGVSRDTSLRESLLSILPKEVLDSVRCSCGGALDWELDFDPRFYSIGAPVVGESGGILFSWELASLQLTRRDLFIDNSLRCLPPKQGDSQYPTGEVKKKAEAMCRQYDRWGEFEPTVDLINIHPAAIAREPTPLPLGIKTFEKAKHFYMGGERPLVMCGGKAVSMWIGHGSTVQTWLGHYEMETKFHKRKREERRVAGMAAKTGPKVKKEKKLTARAALELCVADAVQEMRAPLQALDGTEISGPIVYRLTSVLTEEQYAQVVAIIAGKPKKVKEGLAKKND